MKKLTTLEEQLVQTKIKSTEGDLNFPTMLDEQLTPTISACAVDAGDAAPTRPQAETFQMLSAKIQEQLNLWDGILSQDLNGLNRAARKAEDSAYRRALSR